MLVKLKIKDYLFGIIKIKWTKNSVFLLIIQIVLFLSLALSLPKTTSHTKTLRLCFRKNMVLAG